METDDQDTSMAVQKKAVTHWGQALKLLLKKAGFSVNRLETDEVMQRNDWYQLIKTPSPGLEKIQVLLDGIGLTWQDWAQAYSVVTGQEQPATVTIKIDRDIPPLIDWFEREEIPKMSPVKMNHDQVWNRAMAYYLKDTQRLGFDYENWMPRASHIEEDYGHSHSAEGRNHYKKPKTVKNLGGQKGTKARS